MKIFKLKIEVPSFMTNKVVIVSAFVDIYAVSGAVYKMTWFTSTLI